MCIILFLFFIIELLLYRVRSITTPPYTTEEARVRKYCCSSYLFVIVVGGGDGLAIVFELRVQNAIKRWVCLSVYVCWVLTSECVWLCRTFLPKYWWRLFRITHSYTVCFLRFLCFLCVHFVFVFFCRSFGHRGHRCALLAIAQQVKREERDRESCQTAIGLSWHSYFLLVSSSPSFSSFINICLFATNQSQTETEWFRLRNPK